MLILGRIGLLTRGLTGLVTHGPIGLVTHGSRAHGPPSLEVVPAVVILPSLPVLRLLVHVMMATSIQPLIVLGTMMILITMYVPTPPSPVIIVVLPAKHLQVLVL